MRIKSSLWFPLLVVLHFVASGSGTFGAVNIIEKATNKLQSTQARIAKLEQNIFGKTNLNLSILDRLDALEIEVLGEKHVNETLLQRLDKLETIFGQPNKRPTSSSSDHNPQGTESLVGKDGLAGAQSAKADLTGTLADAVNAYDKKQIEKAKDLFEKVLIIDPSNSDANYSLGCIAEDRGDFLKAQNYYEKASTGKPNDSEIIDALKNIKAKIKQGSPIDRASDDVSKATSEFRAGHYREAKAALERILTINPANDRAHFALAECFRHLQDKPSAIAHFKEAARLKPDNAIYRSELARVTSRGFDAESYSSRHMGDIVPIDAPNGGAPRRIDAVSWEARNLIAEARPAIDRLIDATSNADPRAITDAESQLSNLRKLPPDPMAEVLDQITSYHARGSSAVKQGLLGEALADYRKAFSLNPWDAEEALDLVRLEIQNQDWSMAQQHCMAAIACKPSAAANWLDLGLILLHKQEPDRAETCFAIADAHSGSSGTSPNFIRQALSATSDQSRHQVLEKALLQSQISQRMAYIGVKGIPNPDVPDPSMVAYKAVLLLQLADKWSSESSGMIVVATIDRDGKLIGEEVVKSSGDKDLDERAKAAIKSLEIPALPSWFTGNQRQFIINFEKVKTLANSPFTK